MTRSLITLLALLSGAAYATDDDGLTYGKWLSAMALGVVTGNDRNTEDGYGARVLYGQRFAESAFWEAGGYAGTIETDLPGSDVYTRGLGLDIGMQFGDRSSLTPFILAGGGASYNDVNVRGRDDTSGYVNAGVGLVSGPMLTYHIRLRAEARYVRDFYADDLEDLHVGIGLELPLGKRAVDTVEKVVVVRETVEIAVAERDSDGDSVPDGRDQCPNTLRGTRVDADGCIIGNQILTVQNVNFTSGSANLLPSSEAALNNAALALQSQPDLRLTVAGHTDSRGDDAYNRDLSQRRAAAVKRFLVDAGVDGERIDAVGFGESEPVADNTTTEGRAMNRRVEFRLETAGEEQ